MNNPHLLAGAALLALALSGCRPPEKSAEAPSPLVANDRVTFPAGSPQLGAITVEEAQTHPAGAVQLFGRLMWNDDVTVRIFTPLAGRIGRLIANPGDEVATNAPLLEIDSPDFGQAQADERSAESQLRLADSNLSRLRELLAHGAVAQKDVDAAEADHARAAAEQARSAARLAAYGAKGDIVNGTFVLRSPVSGVVVERNANPGQEVRPDQMLANMPQYTQPLFVVTDPHRLWLQIDATELDLPRLQPGRNFLFTTRAFPGQTFTGRVDFVSEFIDPSTRTVKVRGAVENPGRRLKAEMFVTIGVPASDVVAVRVPARAIFLAGDRHYVFIEDQPQQFVRQEIKTGPELDGLVEVESGVQIGQRVVTDGCILLEQLLQ